MGGLVGWSYRKSITISRSSGAVTNHPMKLLVGESSGATGEDVDCGGKCLSTFDDLRFTTSDGTTLLDYWIESTSGITPNQLATVWIEFNSIGTSDTTFYMYYGNSGASAGSSITSTFPFADDFNDASIDTDKWFHWIDNGSESESSGEFSVTGHASYNAWGAKTKFGVNYAYCGRAKVNTDDTASDAVIFGIDDRSADGNYSGSGRDQAVIQIASGKKYAVTREGTFSSATRTTTLTSFADVEIQRIGTSSVKFVIDGLMMQEFTTNIPTDNCGLIIYSNNASVTVTWDWVFVRDYLATEAAWGSWGEEEYVPAYTINMKHNYIPEFLGGN